MSISNHEQQVLDHIEDDLASTGPKLAAMLAMFARLTAGEEMPARERIRHAFDRPAAAGRGITGADAAVRPARRRRTLAQLRRQSVWLVWLVAAIALIAWALTVEHGTGKGACPLTQTAACRQIPAGPGGTPTGGP